MKILRLLIPILISLLIEASTAEDIIGCGGFIKSNTEINFKIIKVKLLTKDGAVKYTTEASPVNGYYMIPVYTKGEYILQVNPPPGWSFEPSQVMVNIDGQTDACSKNEDINFFFKGFGLSGKVVSQGDSKNRGPSGVKLNLISNGKQIDSTLSSNDGSYYFSNVMPGVYQVEALHPTYKFLVNKVQVELSKENWSAKDNIIISGYNIEGTVQTLDKTGVQNALVELHFADSATNLETKNFGCDQSLRKGSLICTVKTDSNGKFTFSNVVYGNYKLVATYSTNNLQFQMKPEVLNVDLTKHSNLELTENFILNSVTLTSKVLLSKDKPLGTADVFLNDKKLSVNQNGLFFLEQLTSGNYKVSIRAKNVYFEEKLVNLDLNSGKILDTNSDKFKSLLSLSEFLPKSFDVCGQIGVLKNSDLLNNVAESIQVKCYLNNKLVKSVNLDKDLKYCVVLDTGLNYILKAELSEKLSQVLRLVPHERNVLLKDSPIFDANFEQLEAKLEGQIDFLPNQSAPSDLVVTLKSVDSKWTQNIPVKCSAQQKNENIIHHTCSFNLNNLLFGNYEIKTNYDDLYCWKKSNDQKSLTISVNSELQKIKIEQSGYKLNYRLSHKNALFKLIDTNKNILLNRNILSDSDRSGEICLPKIEDYSAVIDSCHRFSDAKSDQDLIQVKSDLFQKGKNNLVLNALRHQVTVDLVYKYDNEKDKLAVSQNDLRVLVKLEQKIIEVIKLSVKGEDKNQIVFFGKTWLESDKEYSLVGESEKVLFETNNKNLRINEDKCDLNNVKFETILGIFLIGDIQPKDLDSIDLTLKSTVDNSIIQQSVINSAQGFKLGPLRAPYSLYTVELSKSGYLFNIVKSESSDGNYNLQYQVQKLGQLKVNVVDAKLKSNLENVLLSLSSENRQFRQTYRTDSNGLVSFDNLKPGLYYLLVMMQEFEFTPNSHPVQITDGFHANLLVEANRVAYSVFGKVTSINGQAESDVTVEAKGLRSVSDESDSDNENCRSSRENSQVDNLYGTYRIRNLKPNCEYELIIQSGVKKERQFKIIPQKYLLTINNSDVLDRNFVLVDQLERMDVSIGVNYKLNEQISLKKQLNNFVRVKLFKTSQPDQIIQTVYSVVNSVVYLNSLPRDKNQYSVLVELLLPSTVSVFGALNQAQILQLQQQPVVDKTELSFYADNSHRHLNLEFNNNQENEASDFFDLKREQYQNVYFTLPLFIIIVSLVLNYKTVQTFLLNLRSQISQRGGILNYLASSLQKQPSPEQNLIQSSKPSKSVKTGKKSKDQGSDSETVQRIVKQKQAQVVNPTQANEGSSDQSEGENIGYTTEEGDMLVLHPVKRKVKRAL
ncbi:unnamed protein product [Brachionus calyciflorus]|uniref:Nodal modulator 1 n=1 Tax=Brachionus calyciflorus TaxID=104777 RepID=A0A813TG35_9BILA|nr:unnamed protein product [Brachionus calyciflorus]